MNPKLKITTALVPMFLFGAITGISLTVFLHPYFFSPPRAQDIQKRMLSFLDHRLHLSPEQEQQITPITVDFANQAQALHTHSLVQISQLAAATDERIKQFLTADQQIEMDRMTREWEENFVKHGAPPYGIPPGGPPSDGHPPGNPAPPPPPSPAP